MGNKELGMQPAFYFGRGCGFEEESECFDQILAGFFYSLSLTGNIEIWTKGNISIVLSFYDCGETLCAAHDLCYRTQFAGWFIYY